MTRTEVQVALPNMKPYSALRLAIEKLHIFSGAYFYKVNLVLSGEAMGKPWGSQREVLVVASLTPARKLKISQMLGLTTVRGVEGANPKMTSLSSIDLARWLDGESATRHQRQLILPELRKAIETEINNKLPEA